MFWIGWCLLQPNSSDLVKSRKPRQHWVCGALKVLVSLFWVYFFFSDRIVNLMWTKISSESLKAMSDSALKNDADGLSLNQ